MQCVLQILRGESVDPMIDEVEWEAVLALAEEEGLLPWVAAQLKSRGESLPQTISDRLGNIEREARVTAFYWNSELKGILRALDESRVAAVPLKGPFLGERLYGGSALRACRDLDVLVSTGDLDRAETVLSAAGFVPGIPDDYHRQWYRGTTIVELHHDVENPLAFDFCVESALRKARPATFQGQRCRQLAAEDELLFLCLHAARHRFDRLSLILDLRLAFEKLACPRCVWQPRPEVAGLNGLVALGLAMARRLRPELAVTNQFAATGSPHLERLADRLWHRLLTQSGEPLDWRRLHSFYLEIELPGRKRFHRRWRHLQILCGRVIDRDFRFAAELGLRRPWQARMLRPLRLLSERVRH